MVRLGTQMIQMMQACGRPAAANVDYSARYDSITPQPK